MKQHIKNFFTKNIKDKLLSLGLAIIIWAVVVAIDDPVINRNFSSIEVELLNEESILNHNQVYEVLDSSNFVGITVTAQRSIIDALSRDDFLAVADLNDLRDGNVAVTVKSKKYADRIVNIEIRNNDKVKLLVQDIVEKQFIVQASCSGTAPEGYMAGKAVVDNNIVRVSGPENLIEKIAGAKAIVDVTDIKSDIDTSVGITLVDKDDKVITGKDLLLDRTNVGVKVEMWKLKNVPLEYAYQGTLAEGFGLDGEESITPAYITVAGPIAAIDSLSSVLIPDSAVSIEGANDDINLKIPIEKYLPEKITIADVENNNVAVIYMGVSELEKKKLEIPAANITAINVPQGMKASIGGIGEVVVVEVAGLGAAYEQITPVQIKGNVDVSKILPDSEGQIQPGEYELPVDFVMPEGVGEGDNSIIVRLFLQDENDA